MSNGLQFISNLPSFVEENIEGVYDLKLVNVSINTANQTTTQHGILYQIHNFKALWYMNAFWENIHVWYLNRQTDRETDRRTDGWIDRLAYLLKCKAICWSTELKSTFCSKCMVPLQYQRTNTRLVMNSQTSRLLGVMKQIFPRLCGFGKHLIVLQQCKREQKYGPWTAT